MKATQLLSQADDKALLTEMAGYIFQQVETRLLKLDGSVPEGIMDRLNRFDYVIVGLYSRNPGIAAVQSSALKRINKIRGDVIVVALGNPYDISHFPEIKTYLATYGFRRVQIEALFKVLIGDIEAVGECPVRIHGIV